MFKLTDEFHDKHPEAREVLSEGNMNVLGTNIFESVPQAFSGEKDSEHSIKVVGRTNNSRTQRYINSSYISEPDNLYKYKIFLPKAIGTGKFGEKFPESIIEGKGVAHTQSFVSIGAFNTEEEAQNCWKYLKTKFARCMLHVLKSTQDATPSKWKYVPLQDFTSASDIDWSKSVAEIDQQLYAKYGLDEHEVEFIETKVKAME